MAKDIAVRGLTIAIDHRPLLHDITHVFQDSAVTLVLGNNGSGKTLLLEALSGLRQADAGEIRIGEKLLWKERKPERALLLQLGVAFQSPEQQLFAGTLREEFEYSLKPYRMNSAQKESAMNEALEHSLGAPEQWLERDPFTLSGGQQRRLAMALTGAVKPQWLLLDEPTSGLDRGGMALLLRMLQQRKASGKGSIVITHDPEHLLPLADEVVLLREGSIVWSGTPDALAARPERFSEAGMELPEPFHTLSKLRTAGIALPGGLTATNLISSVESACAAAPPSAALRPPAAPSRGTPANTFDPRALWLAYLFVSTGMLLQSTWWGWAAGALLAATAIGFARIPYRIWSKPAYVLLLFTAITAAAAGLRLDGSRVFDADFDFAPAIETFFRFSKLILIMLTGFALLHGIPPLKLKRSLEQGLSGLRRIRFPVEPFAMTAALTVRFIPMLFQLWNRFSRIAAARGKFPVHPGSVPLAHLRTILLPFLIALLRLGETISLVLDVRGAGWQGIAPTQAYRCAFRSADYRLLALSAAVLGALLALRFLT